VPFVKIIAAGLALTLLGLLAGWGYYEWREHSQDQPLLDASRRYRADPALVKAVAWRETWFNPARRGRASEIGLMQILPLTGGEWAAAEHLAAFDANDLFDSRTNAMAGAWYLQKLIARYARTDNPVPYALADYNAGRGRVLQWIKGASATNSRVFVESIPFPGTKAYVRATLRRYERYRPVFPPAAPVAP